ncbi:hypothetical protein Pst134EA_007622 [Puccinia striiformis f. sp. tritici]|uniref:hypothetical protein n=1 Tax=Puccinia striiformis f. sp. tritici TaxID=168172 RepID=UPI002008D378|nr:hypothetical protein Pst134EA_007622 [Puccinia striiformis f. sp. tritici]KAH9470357.1 hypothetical protein Pst134EA_007622 [Puccinia striiformis f. sp. tritici]
MHTLKALATAMILLCEMAYVVPDVICGSSEQPLCDYGLYSLFRKPLVYHTGIQKGQLHCPPKDARVCCPGGTIKWTSKNEHNYVKVVGPNKSQCHAAQEDRHHH